MLPRLLNNRARAAFTSLVKPRHGARFLAIDADLSSLGLNDEDVKRIRDLDTLYRNKYKDVENALPSGEADAVKRKRLIYRSKQRGWLEVDLLLGSWASKNVPNLDAKQLDEYQMLLEEETIDIFNFINGKQTLPPHLENLSIIHVLKEYAYSAQINSPTRYAELKEQAKLT